MVGELGARNEARREAPGGNARRRRGARRADRLPRPLRFCKILNPFFDGILQKLVARGIALALDELPRRYVSREFLTL